MEDPLAPPGFPEVSAGTRAPSQALSVPCSLHTHISPLPQADGQQELRGLSMEGTPLSQAGFTLPSLVCISHYSSSEKGELKHGQSEQTLAKCWTLH